jgi:hypothetical protein
VGGVRPSVRLNCIVTEDLSQFLFNKIIGD